MFAARSARSSIVDGYSTTTGASTFKLEHTEGVSGMAWSPVGVRLAVAWAGSSAFSAHVDATANSPRLTVWDMVTLTRLYTTEVDNTNDYKPKMANLVWSPDGTKIAGATVIPGNEPGADSLNVILIWDSATGEQTAALEQRIVHFAAFSPDSKRIATWTGDSGTDAPRGSPDILIWDATTGELITSLWGEDRANIYDATWLAGGKQLISAAGNGTITVWDTNSSTQVRTIRADDRSFVHTMAISPNEQKVVAGNSNYTSAGVSMVWVWDIATGELVDTIGDHRAGIGAVGWLGDGRVLTVSDSLVAIHDAASGEPLLRLASNMTYTGASPLQWADDGRILTNSDSELSTAWDVSSGKPLRVEPEKPDLRTPDGSTASPDGKRAVRITASRTAIAESTVTIYDIATGETVTKMYGPPSSWFKIVWSADGSRLAVGGGLDEDIFVGYPWNRGWLENMVMVWDTATWEEIGRFVGHNGRVLDLAFSPDGTLLASSSSDGTVIVWQVGR
jgi:WD40 repeat protein